MQSKFATLSEFPDAGSNMQKIFSTNRRSSLHERLADIVASIFHETKTVALIASVDHFFDILSNVFRQLQKQSLGFFFCERSHGAAFISKE